MTTHKLVSRRQLVYLALLALAVFLFIPHLTGFNKVGILVSNAQPVYLLIALGAEMLRYFASSGSTVALARLFDRPVPYFEMTEAFFAGAALNRVFSTGGAPGMVVRLVFLLKHHVTTGSVAAIYLIEDIIGLVIGLIIFVVGIVTIASRETSSFANDLAVGFAVGTIPLAIGAIFVIRNRPGMERLVHGLARAGDTVFQRFFHRSIYTPERVEHSLDDFYLGMNAARCRPHLVALSFLMNGLRYGGGSVALYFSFLALDQAIAPGVLLLLYTTTSLLSSTSAVLGEVAIMGTGFAILSRALGLAPDVAVVGLIVSRTLAFWMPLPVGLLAFLHLRQRHDL
ncbi:MAG: flippase-like domain-containing protein [Chloroflexi bacterium]|nr:flippase-like domain-containing protein [Chloroflexota bacterium]